MDRKQAGNVLLYGLSAWGAVSSVGVLGLVVLLVPVYTLQRSVRSEADEERSDDDGEVRYEKLMMSGPSDPEPEEKPTDAPKRARAPAPGAKSMMFADAGAIASPATVAAMAPEPPPPPGAPGADAGEGGGERLRQWFPEAFLWRPLVETDASGVAVVPVKVPDQLTTWRVLALAHTRGGSQAGDVATFDSRLELYVDPVVPAFLYAGDRVELPIQVMNTTSREVRTGITVSSDGALTGQAAGTVALAAGGSAVQRVSLFAEGAGISHVTAVLEGADAAQREIPVLPRGRPEQNTRGGTVSDRASFAIAGPSAADLSTQELEVRVFPGPLAVLASEVDRGGSGATPWNAAYGFALATHLADLSARASIDLDPDLLRRLKILSWQRVVVHARSPDAGTATDLLAAVRGTTGYPQAEELEARLERTVIQGQRADGTWSRSGSGSINRVLVDTAFSARTLSADATGARTKAKGALLRNQRHIDDAYTAAVALASGLLDGDDAARLRKLVDDAAVDAGDGRKTVAVPGAAVNAWGQTPSRAEMLAWTVLALPADAAWRGDLVAELMSGYSALWGFGAGPADVVALEAVSYALPGLDKPVDVVLSVDGVEVDRRKLDPSQPKLPAVLHAKGAVGAVEVAVSPGVPGLAYVATLRSWVPWSGSERAPGVDVEVAAAPMRVGQDSAITLTVAAPSGLALALEQGLAAGATVDELALDAISDRIVSYDVTTDRVRLVTRPFQAGEIMSVPITVRPAFAGDLTTVPLAIEPGGDADQRVELAPIAWVVAP